MWRYRPLVAFEDAACSLQLALQELVLTTSMCRIEPGMTHWPSVPGVPSKVGIIHSVGSIIPQAQAGIQAADGRLPALHTVLVPVQFLLLVRHQSDINAS